MIAMKRPFAASVWRKGNWYVSQCLELDVASQGNTIEEARKNVQEAVELFLENASADEVNQRLHGEVYVTQFEVTSA